MRSPISSIKCWTSQPTCEDAAQLVLAAPTPSPPSAPSPSPSSASRPPPSLSGPRAAGGKSKLGGYPNGFSMAMRGEVELNLVTSTGRSSGEALESLREEAAEASSAKGSAPKPEAKAMMGTSVRELARNWREGGLSKAKSMDQLLLISIGPTLLAPGEANAPQPPPLMAEATTFRPKNSSSSSKSSSSEAEASSSSSLMPNIMISPPSAALVLALAIPPPRSSMDSAEACEEAFRWVRRSRRAVAAATLTPPSCPSGLGERDCVPRALDVVE
mmetsp:Transcript_122934/g.393830  ORF Transcript_122934/g.393830 Transcript_122934/m.393830 type:complete len:273 (+) Transcript_122934:281-1099(+)